MSTDYTELDAAIVKAIETLPSRTFNDIFVVIRPLATLLAEASDRAPNPLKQGRDATEAWRILDRRLQALKNARVIVYRNRAWEKL